MGTLRVTAKWCVVYVIGYNAERKQRVDPEPIQASPKPTGTSGFLGQFFYRCWSSP